MNMIDEALDLLRNEGWIKGESETENGRCMSGAVRRIALNERRIALNESNTWLKDGRIGRRAHSLQLLEEVINEQYPEIAGSTCSVPYFNDLDYTTFADIEQVMEKASLRYDELYG